MPMPRVSAQQREAIRRCQSSMAWFLRNFAKVKHPSAGIVPFSPFKYQLKAIRAFRQHRLNIFRKCFVEGSMVWTPSGPRPIQEIKPGDTVYAFDERNKSLVTSTVKNSWSSGQKDTVVVRTKSGHRSVCTPDHPFLTRRGWVQAIDLTLNDVIVEVNDHQRYQAVDESEAILLGYLVTDGYYSGYKGRRQFHFTNTTWRYLLEYQKHFELRFGKRLRIRQHNKNGKKIKKAYRILTSCIEARRWLKSLGLWGDKAETKKLPEIVFSWDNRSIAVLLNRMFAGDGWYSGKHCNEVGIGSKSILLLNQVKQLLTRFGIDSKVYQATGKSIAKLRIFGTDSFSRFVDQIGIFGKTPRHQPTTTGFFRNRIKGQVKSIVPGSVEPVWDLEIDTYHNFIVDGAVAHNCRQAGISKISGAFALWFAMFNANKTVLIVSRTDMDAMGFLRDQIKFLFEHLPLWMQELWKPTKDNEHEFFLPNGSKIKSLTSHPDVLRSNASSLVIIDEAAFIQSMDIMWAAGWPTLQHGGNAIVISTTNGVGNWYWSTVTDAEAGVNPFNPCIINWWDMDWAIEYIDPLSKQKRRIAPCDDIVECKGQTIQHPKHGSLRLDVIKYGPWWSPWLEDQYRALQEQGEAWKFEQEVLALFVGSGNTVLSKEVLAHVQTTLKEPSYKVQGLQTYVHPTTGITEELDFDFRDANEGLWIWEKPVVATPVKKRGNVIIDPGQAAHSYVMGVDIATGKGRDYSAIEVFDVNTRKQVAEFMAHCLPREFVKFIDRIGRWYNCALAVIERNNGGDTLIDMLRHDIMYPRIWRKKDINDKPRPMQSGQKARPLKVAPYGFSTTTASKPTLNKFLIDYIRDNEEDGYTVFSKRLLKQFQTYVRKRDRSGRDTMKTEAEDGAANFDDLVMACAMALVGTSDAYIVDSGNLVPLGPNGGGFKVQTGPKIMSDATRVDAQELFAQKGGPALLMPMALAPTELPETSAQRVLDAYTVQLGGIPISQGKPLVTPKRYFYERE